MAENPILSFIICTYNRAGYLGDSLETLLESAGGNKVEIVVIDNNSSDNTKGVCDTFARSIHNPSVTFRYARETSQGLSYARNRGVVESTAPILIFLDDDITVPKNFVQAWLDFFSEYPHAKAAGGKIRVQFDDPRPHWMSSYLLPLLGHHDLGDSIKPYPTSQFPFGGNMAFKREVFSTFGVFNTELGRIGKDLKASEEKEFFRRLQDRQTDIYYVPDAMLYHRVNKSRLTKEYIRRQAIGLGESLAVQIKMAAPGEKLMVFLKESGKWIASIILLGVYAAKLQPSKGSTLIQFRYWIFKGLSR
jgi:glycosyltransferase involved in cell wall biosynthesis